MKTYLNLFIIVLFGTSISYSQIPIEIYKSEISDLKTEADIDAYWKNLYHLDQNVLLKLKNAKASDSMSICNMIRTALVLDIHGTKTYKFNNFVPIVNLGHNLESNSSLAFWPIIQKCENTGGAIKQVYPAYQLENISLTIYSYSLLNQEAIYPDLIEKLNKRANFSVIQNLVEAFNYQKKLQNLTQVEILNSWIIQPFTNLKEEGSFEFVKMSDNAVYLRKHGQLQKLNLLKTNNTSKFYKIENEPFGWYYEYKNNGDLSLYNDKNQVLIQYTKHQ